MFSGRVTWSRLWWVGLIVLVSSLVVNLLIRAISMAIFNLPTDFAPLGIGPVIFWSFVGGIGAVVVFWLVGRFSRNPALFFLMIGFLVYIATFYPDWFIIAAGSHPFKDTTPYTVGTLMSMHAAEAIIAVCVLLFLGFEKASSASTKSPPHIT